MREVSFFLYGQYFTFRSAPLSAFARYYYSQAALPSTPSTAFKANQLDDFIGEKNEATLLQLDASSADLTSTTTGTRMRRWLGDKETLWPFSSHR